MLAIIIPVLNEQGNIEPMVQALHAALHGINYEIIFVDDDSADGSVELLKQVSALDSHVRYIHRVGRRGLASACIEGMCSSPADYFAVMDGDLQHDEAILPQMLQSLQSGQADIAIGSRYVARGSVGEFNAFRQFVSKVATTISRVILKRTVLDPMSGYFMLSRQLFYRTVRSLSGKGFKILLDILASAPKDTKVTEIPFTFRSRQWGASKLDSAVVWEFLVLIFDKLVGGVIPAYLVLFAAVGVVGTVAHQLVLWVCFRLLGWPFDQSLVLAIALAVNINFVLNNMFTYHDRRLKGWAAFKGWISFILLCSLGAIINYVVAKYLKENLADKNVSWNIGGLIGAVLAGIFNYSTTSIFTWNREIKKKQR